MFYKKEGYPEEDELVICTVKQVLPHSVFCDLDEYKNKEGLLHISEVAPGRIRNIRDYVIEGKKVVCKVLRIDKEKNHIDLSLRRVSLSKRTDKEREYKQEQKAEKLLEVAGEKLEMSLDEMYKKAGYAIINKYILLHNFFQEVSQKGESLIIELGIDKKITSVLAGLIKEKIRVLEVEIKGTLVLKSNESDGIERIKKVIKDIKEINKGIMIRYVSAPKYSAVVSSKNYKDAEDIVKKITNKLPEILKKNNAEGEFLR